MKIKCVTLFDITKTDVSNRRRFLDESRTDGLDIQRSQQSNFETIIQIISMRAQPENITDPIQEQYQGGIQWGKKYGKKNKILNQWWFYFEVSQSSVFSDHQTELGKLFLDCDGVPMISNLNESIENINSLDISTDLKNIHFEVVHE